MDRYLCSSSSVPESSNDSYEDALCSLPTPTTPESSFLGKRPAGTQVENSNARGSKRSEPKEGDYRRLLHTEWEVNFLVVYNKKSDTCLKCNKKIESVKIYTLLRHCERVHPDTKNWSTATKLFVEHAKHKMKQMQESLVHNFAPSTLPQIATYKLSFTPAKH